MTVNLVTFTNIIYTWSDKESRSAYAVVAINPARVSSVRPNDNGSTLILFGDGDGGVNVTEPYDEVIRRLKEEA